MSRFIKGMRYVLDGQSTLWRLGAQRKSIRPRLEMLEKRDAPALLTVNTSADALAANPVLSLREAVLLVDNGGNSQAALGRNLTPGEKSQISGAFGTADRIQLSSTLDRQTITLSGTPFSITKPVIIDGLAAPNLVIDGNNMSRIFTIDNGTPRSMNVSLFGLTLSRGNVNGAGGAIYNAENLTVYQGTLRYNHATTGGAIDNAGYLYVSSLVTLASNSADNGGGAISNTGTLIVDNSFFNFNSAAAGAALDNGSAAAATINGSSFDGNRASGAGGGAIRTAGTLNCYSTAFTFNSAADGFGGAIDALSGKSTVGGNYLFKNNFALLGGALYNASLSTTVLYGGAGGAVFARNSVRPGYGGGAIYNAGTLVIDGNTIFEANHAAYGAAIVNVGNASVNRPVFNLNVADTGDGGAVFNAGTMLLNICMFMNNQAVGNGGAVANLGSLKVFETSITANRCDSKGVGMGHGGGIYSAGPAATLVHNTTIAGNFAGTGSTDSDVFGPVVYF
jgi:predicted outer membrane repeat protein